MSLLSLFGKLWDKKIERGFTIKEMIKDLKRVNYCGLDAVDLFKREISEAYSSIREVYFKLELDEEITGFDVYAYYSSKATICNLMADYSGKRTKSFKRKEKWNKQKKRFLRKARNAEKCRDFYCRDEAEKMYEVVGPLINEELFGEEHGYDAPSFDGWLGLEDLKSKNLIENFVGEPDDENDESYAALDEIVRMAEEMNNKDSE